MYEEHHRGGRDSGRGRRGTPLSDLDPALTEVSRRVIGCAIEVHKALGPGFPEDVYENALKHELDDAKIKYSFRKSVDVNYRGKTVGAASADFVIADRFIVDLMAEHTEIGGVERAALRALLRAADLELGLIINFGERRLKDGLVRVLNPDKLNAARSDEDDRDEDHDDDDDHDHDHDEDDEDGVYDPD